jgi:hypothetical protein
MRLLLAVGICAVGLVGCGDEEEENPPPQSNPAEVNPAVAQASARAIADAVALAQTGDGLTAAFALSALGTSAMAMVTPSGQAQPQSISPDGSSQQALTSGVCECDESSCTFDGCADDGSSFSITGTMSWSATSLDCDLTLSGAAAGAQYTFDQQCALTFSETSLDGTFDSAGSFDIDANGQSVSTTWDSGIAFDSITLTSGCPTAGSISVEATVTANGQSYSGSGSVELDGTGC